MLTERQCRTALRQRNVIGTNIDALRAQKKAGRTTAGEAAPLRRDLRLEHAAASTAATGAEKKAITTQFRQRPRELHLRLVARPAAHRDGVVARAQGRWQRRRPSTAGPLEKRRAQNELAVRRPADPRRYPPLLVVDLRGRPGRARRTGRDDLCTRGTRAEAWLLSARRSHSSPARSPAHREGERLRECRGRRTPTAPHAPRLLRRGAAPGDTPAERRLGRRVPPATVFTAAARNVVSAANANCASTIAVLARVSPSARRMPQSAREQISSSACTSPITSRG